MLQALYIFIDDDFNDPIYADPDSEDVDEDLWHHICEAVNDALEGDAKSDGSRVVGETRFAWKVFLKTGLSFVVATDDEVKPSLLDKYLVQLSRQYMDEVDDIRHPDRDGVADVVVDVIPPWEDED